MTTKRAFISFDFDHDEDIRNLLVGQAKNRDSPFSIVDASVKYHLSGDWEKKVRNRIRRADLVIVICGQYTHKAEGVTAEVRMTQEEGKRYSLLRGHKDRICTKPKTARSDDELLDWTWDNLRKQIEGKTFIESTKEWLDTPAPWVLAGIAGLALLLHNHNRKLNIQDKWHPGARFVDSRIRYPRFW